VLAAENSQVTAAIVAANEDLRAVPLTERFAADRAAALAGFGVDSDALAVTPDRHSTDGFYAHLFRRT
jgi:16S rRNA C967 or C1407 C5-methylase (RsmB/RsmF family)